MIDCGNAANLEGKTKEIFASVKKISLFCPPDWLHSHRRARGLLTNLVMYQVEKSPGLLRYHDPVVSIVKLNFLFKSPGQTESQIDASWRKFSICVRVSFGHPRALSCDDLRWLWSSSNSNASRRKFFTNTCRSQVSCICVNYAFCDLPWTYEQTCESVWPPIASPYASSGFANLRRLASTCESVWPGLKMFLWAEFDNYKLLFLSPLLCYSDHCHTETTAQSNWIITSQKHICISMLHSVQHKKVDTADQKQTSPVGVPS